MNCFPLNKYIFVCDTEAIQVSTWGTDIPIECPNNSGHTIDPSTINIIDSLNPIKVIKINPEINSIDSTIYNRITYHEVSSMKYAIVKGIIWMDSINTSYTVKVYDKTNSTTLLETTLTNITESVQTIGTLTDLSSTEIEIFVKKTGGDAYSNVYINNITIYYS